MRIWLGSWVVLAMAALGAACSSSSASPGGGGGSAGSDAAVGGSGGGSGTAGSAGSGGTAGNCQGDATKWMAITQGPFPCTKNSDCCVVVNSCVNQAQVMLKTDYDKGGADLWPYCTDQDCTNCIPPAVDVVCDNGQCGLEELSPLDASPDKSNDHCGVDSMPVVSPVKPTAGCN